MSDMFDRLTSALAFRYAVERELGTADHADGCRYAQMKLDD
jgi:hypothetical protein